MQRQNTLDVEQGVSGSGVYAQLDQAGAGQGAPSNGPMEVLSACWQAVSRALDCFGSENGNPNASSLSRLPALEVNGELLVVSIASLVRALQPPRRLIFAA